MAIHGGLKTIIDVAWGFALAIKTAWPWVVLMAAYFGHPWMWGFSQLLRDWFWPAVLVHWFAFVLLAPQHWWVAGLIVIDTFTWLMFNRRIWTELREQDTDWRN